MVVERLEERVANLEQEFAAFRQVVFAHSPSRDWRGTFGMFANDPGFDEVLRLGREIRQRESVEESGDARS